MTTATKQVTLGAGGKPAAVVAAKPVDYNDLPDLVSLKGKGVFTPIKNSLLRGFIPVETKVELDTNPRIRWIHGKISFKEWCRLTKYLVWSYATYKQEAHVYLYHNTETQEWKAWAYPQKGSHAFVELEENTPEYAAQRKQFPYPWVCLGTVHHHSSMSAFASGTDVNDEYNRDGLHITLGKMADVNLDYHARAVYDKTITDVDITDWVSFPEEIEDLIVKVPQLRGNLNLLQMMLSTSLHNSLYPDLEFPEIWKTNTKQRTPTFAGSGFYSQRSFWGEYSGYDFDDDGCYGGVSAKNLPKDNVKPYGSGFHNPAASKKKEPVTTASWEDLRRAVKLENVKKDGELIGKDATYLIALIDSLEYTGLDVDRLLEYNNLPLQIKQIIEEAYFDETPVRHLLAKKELNMSLQDLDIATEIAEALMEFYLSFFDENKERPTSFENVNTLNFDTSARVVEKFYKICPNL